MEKKRRSKVKLILSHVNHQSLYWTLELESNPLDTLTRTSGDIYLVNKGSIQS
jgi:hypothetical protein